MAFATHRTNYLEIDMTGLQSIIRQVRNTHTRENYQMVLIRSFRRTQTTLRKTISQEIRKEYAVTAGWTKGQIKSARIGFGSKTDGEVHCSIPISGKRGWHGRNFKLTGMRGIRNGKLFNGKRYKIYSKVYVSKRTELPERMEKMGGNPPFISTVSRKKNAKFNQNAINLEGAVMTRTGKDRLPIVKVVGIGVPQMPINRAKSSIEDEFLRILGARIEKEHRFMIQQIASRAGR